MFLVPKSPIVIPITEIPPENVLDGTLGIYAKDDGLHVVDKNNNDKTLITEPIFNNATKEKDTALAVGGYSKIAIDVSHYAGGWEIDGIYIAVSPENLETFQHAEYIWVTYQGERLKLRRSNFLEEMTIEQMWGGRLDSEPLIPIMDYQVFSYNNHDFDFTEGGLIRENLEPICVHDNVFEVKENGDIKSKLINGVRIENEASGDNIVITDSTEAPLTSLRVCGKTKQLKSTGKNMIPFPYEDKMWKEINGVTFVVNDDGSVLVNGTATADAPFFLYRDYDVPSTLPLPVGTYAINSFSTASGMIFQAAIRYNNGEKTIWKQSKSNISITSDMPDATTTSIRIVVYKDRTINNEIIYPMFSSGSAYPDYEPPTNGTFSPSPELSQPMNSAGKYGSLGIDISNEDGSEGQTFSVATPNGLPGVPVSSEGNYTDENGQQWVCDEIDFAKGLYIQRIGEYTLRLEDVSRCASDLDFTKDRAPLWCEIPAEKIPFVLSRKHCGRYGGGLWECGIHSSDASMQVATGVSEFCTSDFHYITEYELEKPMIWLHMNAEDEELLHISTKYEGSKMLLIREEPIETPLTPEMLAEYEHLSTYKPVTTISNDDGAHMEVKYIADTKTYIDNKFAELQATILNNI